MLIWLAVAAAAAGIIMIGPLRWAMAVTAFTLPMAATMVFAVGPEPVTLPVVTCLAFCARFALSLLQKTNRDLFLALLGRELPLLLLVGYCLVSGVLFPRLFAGQAVVPAQDFARDGYAVLGPHLMSFPQMAYLTVAALLYLAMRQSILRAGAAPLLFAVLAQAAFFGGMGFLQAMFGLVGAQFPVEWLVTNTAYAILAVVEEAGFVRITAGFVEASGWASWAAGPLAFCYALFINRFKPGTALMIGAPLAVAMLLSTSSSAYAGLLILSVIAVVHMVLDPSPARRFRALAILSAGAAVFLIAAAFLFSVDPGQGFLGDLRMMLEDMTVRKQYSGSGVERAAWAAAGYAAGMDTMGLGAGFGTVRSSGIVPTLFGSIGVIGLGLFIAFILFAIAPLMQRPRTKADAVRFAAAFALAAAMGPLVVSGSNLDLSLMIWIYAAMARTALAPAPAPTRDRAVGYRDQPNEAAGLRA